MAATPEFAVRHGAARELLSLKAAQYAISAWERVEASRISESWLRLLASVEAYLAASQVAAAQTAEGYVAAAMATDGLAGGAGAAFEVSASAFGGMAADGRPLTTLLYQPVIASLSSIRAGASVGRALATGGTLLEMIARTEVADAGRSADQAALAPRTTMDGYIRVVVGDTCSRCVILAGVWYPYSAGFERHPECDCVSLPRSEATAAGILQDPRRIYDSLTPQERMAAGWSEADQAAIDLGADLNQVTNAHRGVYKIGQRKLTQEGTSRQGLYGGYDFDPVSGDLLKRSRSQGRKRAARLTVGQIFDNAQTRQEAVRLLEQNSYIVRRSTRAALPPVPA